MPVLGFGQTGNEWINFGQTYFKIPIAKDGIFKLTQTDLAAAGVPVNQIDPRRLQIFHRGVEQAIVVQHQQSPADAIFDASEFLEFYGRKNDGTLDAFLYKPATSIPHTYYNLYNDTAYYFLTVNPVAQGKRMTNFSQVNTGSLPAETYQIQEQKQIFSNTYAVGETFNSFVNLTSFSKGEGWSGTVVRENNTSDINFTGISQGVVAGGLPTLELQLLGRGLNNHAVEIYVGANAASLRLLSTQNFFGFDTNTLSTNLAWSDIGASGTLTIRVSVTGANGVDFVSVSYAKVQWPRTYNLNSENERTFTMATNVANKSYLEIQNAPSATRVFDISDVNNPIQIGTTQTATLNGVVDNTQTARKILLTNQTTTPNSIKRVVFRSFNSVSPDYLIISHKQFQKPALGSANPLKAYADYRASVAGGDYDTLTVTIDQLCDQFTYGESTPLAVFRFLKFLETKKRPDYLFIIGKGLNVTNRYYRNPGAFTTYKDFVPSAGFPASDMLYSVGLSDPNTNEPGIATGRLSITQSGQVIQYLNKVIQQESAGFNDLWRKRILHLSGGIAEGEPETFKGYMEGFANVAEDVYLGGSVSAIAKRSLQAQELVNISNEVNDGLGLITFFGHSSTSTTDFDIGFATDPVLGYANDGKYPMVLINGCNAGAFFADGILFGEDWVNAANRGAVGFIAHSSFGLVSTLKRYSDFFYQVAYGDSTFLKKGIGDIQKEVARRYLENVFATATNVSQVQQMVLLGDPAVKLFGAEKPDYHIENASLQVESSDGKAVNSLSPAISLKLVVKNFGRADDKQLLVRVDRFLSDNTSFSYDSIFDPVLYQDTLVITIPNSIAFAGSNRLEIRIDADEKINELREDNNLLSYDLFIPLNGTKNLFPHNFGIVQSTEQEIVFQSANLLDSLRSFQVMIDTSHLFNSDWLKTFVVESKVLGRQVLTLLPNDSLTYYWRTRLLNPSADESNDWETSSFTYIIGSTEGWGQIAFPQYLGNTTTNMLLDEGSKQIFFEETVTPVLIKTFGDLNSTPVNEVSVKIDGAEYNLATQGQPCRDNTINLLAFNRISTVPYAAIPFTFQDPRSCGREPQIIVSFLPTEVYANGVNDLIQAINDVAIGDSVVLFSIGNPVMSGWNPAVISKLAEVGISPTQLTGINDGEPFVFYGKKMTTAGEALLFTSELLPAAEQELVVNRSITGRTASGSMKTALVGPANNWYQLKLKAKTAADDVAAVTVFGISNTGASTVLFENQTTTTDLSAIDASTYPYLRLVYQTNDQVELTPAQLQFWLVEYESLAEGILITQDVVETKVLEEGLTWTQDFGFVNISTKNFSDSLLVNYTSTNQLTNQTTSASLKILAPAPGDTTDFELSMPTLEKAGLNDVQLNVNPRIVPELFYDNNLLSLKNAFDVSIDKQSPVLRVLIDGRLIEHGDFVSANPRIDISVWDENELILKTDTVGIRILLQYPCDENCIPSPIYFTRADVVWQAASLDNPFTATFNPVDLPAGNYILKVFAEDSRGNISGELPYEISFQVSDEDQTTLSAPYPNPNSGVLNFELMIKGNEVPAGAWLELINTMGKLIYEGSLSATAWHVGKNYISLRIEDQLPTGLYLYRIRFANGVLKQGQIVLSR
ncbi:transporter [Chryseotalea sanaruensis]|uniref:Transporter n=1 Tax=Chryseotalea sanaruensis TaxID=2482724 RepID=A0A401UDT9_9BACT|nr:transporter [Chryseotalea sanaruensis]